MTLLNISSPHFVKASGVGPMMRTVIWATLPGLAALTYWFGWGSLINVIWAVFLALVFEALSLWVRGRALRFFLKDSSAILTAVLLGIALPPLAPWWVTLIGVGFAIVLAKHFFGGLGYNPFNPAMVGYVVLLISFPAEMTRWPAPLGFGVLSPADFSFLECLHLVFPFWSAPQVDGYTMATALDVFKQAGVLPAADTLAAQSFGLLGARGWEWVNLGFLLGGAFLLWRRVFTWHAPVGMLGALALLSLLFHHILGVEKTAPTLFHLASGATMLGAFFIITDPVTSVASTKGRLIYGIAIGVLVFVIRTWGNYPDAVAFSVLLMNFAAPFLDYYTQPKAFGTSAGLMRKGGR